MAGTIVLVVEYNGSNYHGSQLQRNAPTIQGELEKALHKLTEKKIRIKAASRTDAGVHARGQVVSFHTDAARPLSAYVDGLNHYLPPDIAVRAAYPANDSLDVRRHAVSREYRYTILNRATRSPLRRDTTCLLGGKLNLSAMRRACRALVGRHDFASFVSSPEAAARCTVRQVHKAEIKREGDTIVFDMVANAFLTHQVRNTVGALLRVGQGKMTPAEFGELVTAKTPGLAGPTAPAGGLCLERVNYREPFDGEAR